MNDVSALAIGKNQPASLSAARKSCIVLGAGLGMVFGFSAAYQATLTVFLKPIAATFGWSRAETSAVGMLAALGLAFGSPLIGGLINRFGAQRVIPVAILLFASGLFALGQAPNSLLYFGACTFLLGFAAVGTTPLGYLTPLPAVFDRRLGLSMGLAMIGLGLGNGLMPVVAQKLISGSDWRSAYEALALAVVIGGAVAVAVLFGASRFRNVQRSEAIGSGGQSELGHDFTSAVRTGRFWTLAIVLFAASGAIVGAMVHMVPALTDRGMPVQQAAQFAALFGIGIIVGRVGSGALLDVFHARYVAAAAFAVGSAGLGLISVSSAASAALVSVSALMFTFAAGAEGDFMPFMVRRYFGLKHFSLLYGVLFGFFAAGTAVGPVLYGWAFDRLGSYTAVYWAGSAVCAACALLVITLGKYAYEAKRSTP